MQGLRSNSALFWAPEKEGVKPPILIFSPRLAPQGTPKNAGVMSHFRPRVGPCGGRGEVANSGFCPALVLENGVVTQPFRPFWASEKAWLRQPVLILSPCLGTPENAGVT